MSLNCWPPPGSRHSSRFLLPTRSSPRRRSASTPPWSIRIPNMSPWASRSGSSHYRQGLCVTAISLAQGKQMCTRCRPMSSCGDRTTPSVLSRSAQSMRVGLNPLRPSRPIIFIINRLSALLKILSQNHPGTVEDAYLACGLLNIGRLSYIAGGLGRPGEACP